jgi:hypothetical protein
LALDPNLKKFILGKISFNLGYKLVYEFLNKYKKGKGIKLFFKQNASFDVLKEIAIQAIQNSSNANSDSRPIQKLIQKLLNVKNTKTIFNKVFLQDPVEMNSDDEEIEMNVKMDVESKYSLRKRKLNGENSPNKKQKLSDSEEELDHSEDYSDREGSE